MWVISAEHNQCVIWEIWPLYNAWLYYILISCIYLRLFNVDWRADSYRSRRHFNNGFKKWIIYWRENNPVHMPRRDKQATKKKKKKRTFLFKDKKNINYSNYFNNAKLGLCIFQVITDIWLPLNEFITFRGTCLSNSGLVLRD